MITALFTEFKSPLGSIRIACTEKGGIKSVEFVSAPKTFASGSEKPHPALIRCKKQLLDYFSGRRKNFDLLLAPKGTDFQEKVWRSLLKISYGKTGTYQGIASAIGKPRAFRAAASAIGANPLAVIVPCHRVIGTDGSMRGYAYGVPLKKKLLNLESPKTASLKSKKIKNAKKN